MIFLLPSITIVVLAWTVALIVGGYARAGMVLFGVMIAYGTLLFPLIAMPFVGEWATAWEVVAGVGPVVALCGAGIYLVKRGDRAGWRLLAVAPAAYMIIYALLRPSGCDIL